MSLDAYSPIYLVLVVSVIFLTSYCIDRLVGPPEVKHRESALDGLRGFLVAGIFAHHAAFWVSRKGGGKWIVPEGMLSSLGPVCVVLFFMATAFLYYGKLLKSHGQKVDWLHIAVSRVLRLTPLCVLMAAAAFGVALSITGFNIVDDISELLKTFLAWASVGLGGSPDINGLKSSWELNAGVMWTLKYEWLFYVCLPFFAVLAAARTTIKALLISAVLIASLLQVIPLTDFRLLISFLGGIAAAYVSQSAALKQLCQRRMASLLVLLCLANVLLSHRNASGVISLILLTVAFVVIACGNDIFGILSLRCIRSFGDIGYSAYLLHGLLLYLAFHAKTAVPFDGSLHPLQHWSTVVGLGMALVVICRLTFKYVEQPAMNAAPAVHAWMKKVSTRKTGFASAA